MTGRAKSEPRLEGPGMRAGDHSTAAGFQGRQMLARAHWAAGAFAGYDLPAVLRIAEAVATAAHAESRRYADWAVKETGFGVAEHKVIKNEACSLGLFERYQGEDLVSPRIDQDAKIVALPRPAGVVLALIPSTNPVASVFFKVILSLLTRNAVVVSPHPMAKGCCTDAADLLAEVAAAAGAPDGIIQVVREPAVRLVETLMSDPVTDVIVATGGTAMVRAAYRSGNPALGVGPGNVPVLVDATAGIAAARAVVRIGGAGHSAAIHSQDPATIMTYGARVPVLRVSVNVGNSTGSSGLETNLAPSMTLGTGFVGRSSIGENLEPRHLVNWTKIAYNADPEVAFGDFAGLSPWRAPAGRVPAYPVASNLPGGGGERPTPGRAAPGGPANGARDSAGPAVSGPVPAGQVPAGQVPVGQVPAGQVPAGPVPAGTALPDSVRAALRVMIIDELRTLVGD